jgi:hypothetical protein
MQKRAALGLWLALGLSGCSGTGRAPKLIELGELVPSHADAGERVRLSGSGFPEGRSAELTLRGELRRAGEPAIRGVEIRARAELVSPHSLELVLTPELVAKLCGKPDARHTTFRGDLEVAFAPRTRTGSPVGGVLDGVVLDVTPDDTSETALATLQSEGARFAAFLGAKLQRSEGGLTVLEIAERSRASRGGLVPGDRVLALDGMIVRDLRDLVPPPNTRVSTLEVERVSERLKLRLEASGFRYHSANTLSGAVLLLGLVFAPLFFLCSPLGRALTFLEWRIADRLRRTHRDGNGETPRTRARALLAALIERLPGSILPYLALVGTSALLTLLALGKTVVAADLDLFLVPVSVSVGLVVATLTSGGGGPEWSLSRGFGRAFGALLVAIPPLMALFAAAVSADTADLRRLVLSQGSLPWQWSIFQSPVALASGALGIAALVPSIRPNSLAQRTSSAGDRLLGIAEWTHKLVLAGALTIAFLGGWQLPGGDESVLSATLGALSLLVKSWIVLALVAFLRWTFGTLDIVVTRKLALTALALPSVVCVLLALGWRWLVASPVLAPLHAESGKILCVTALIALAFLVQRIARGVRPEGPELGIQSWL